ncbi:kinase-like domain-containing protein [Paraphoma chrysanthemicola]|uniref:Kinase-like domain-containing protein n=1 Tax=Paraphoma chrysanthemicola TaxID=798071 RepID=A0A8K0QYV7_9PLEO|nr:kinase-like domain-containing protein [Paraphoma chrysanthemicola]
MDGHRNGVSHTHQRLSSNPWGAFVPHWSLEGYKDPPTDIVTLEKAQAGWKRKFPDHPVRLDIRDDPVPFVQGAILGRGGLGVVYETSIDGIAVAWKRTYIRRISERDLNEIKILSQISEKRHEHIINFIGSYTHRQGSLHEIAVLTWPVARCDLAVLLRELDLLAAWKSRDQPWDVNDWSATPSNEEKDAYDSLLKLEHLEQERSRIFTWHLREKVRTAVAKRLSRAIGCIAKAVNYLHRNGIRHKDIKPSQILLSSQGLWLTDFGMSKDISHLTCSETTGGERATVKYHAPERALLQKCGRAEDIFALGCTYLEVAYRIHEVDARAFLNPQGAPMWSFQANLDSLDAWLWPLREKEEHQPLALTSIVQRMLARSPTKRLTSKEITVELSLSPEIAESFYGSCCRPDLGKQVRDRVDYNESSVDATAEIVDSVDQHPFMLRRFLINDVKSEPDTVPRSNATPMKDVGKGWFTRNNPPGPDRTDLDDDSIDDGEVRGHNLAEDEVNIAENGASSAIASIISMGRNLSGVTQSPGDFTSSLASPGRSSVMNESRKALLREEGWFELVNTDDRDDLTDKPPPVRTKVPARQEYDPRISWFFNVYQGSLPHQQALQSRNRRLLLEPTQEDTPTPNTKDNKPVYGRPRITSSASQPSTMQSPRPEKELTTTPQRVEWVCGDDDPIPVTCSLCPHLSFPGDMAHEQLTQHIEDFHAVSIELD